MNGDAFLFGSSGFAAVAGYPLISVTAGYAFGLPIGVTFMASAWSEPTLIRFASGFEAAVGDAPPAAVPAHVEPRRSSHRTGQPDCDGGSGHARKSGSQGARTTAGSALLASVRTLKK